MEQSDDNFPPEVPPLCETSLTWFNEQMASLDAWDPEFLDAPTYVPPPTLGDQGGHDRTLNTSLQTTSDHGTFAFDSLDFGDLSGPGNVPFLGSGEFGSVVTPQTHHEQHSGSTSFPVNDNRKRKRAKFDNPERRAAVAQVRKEGACLRCRLNKLSVRHPTFTMPLYHAQQYLFIGMVLVVQSTLLYERYSCFQTQLCLTGL